ncbi:hypothetical protein Tco_1117528 [Tanacetum coccineum]
MFKLRQRTSNVITLLKPRGTSWEICTLKYFNTAKRKEEKGILTLEESKLLEYIPMAVSLAGRFIILKLGSGRRGLSHKESKEKIKEYLEGCWEKSINTVLPDEHPRTPDELKSNQLWTSSTKPNPPNEFILDRTKSRTSGLNLDPDELTSNQDKKTPPDEVN